MNPDVLAPYTQNIAQGKKNDSRINAVYNGCLVLYFHFIFAFHRKTHLRCISSVLLHYDCKINANIQDVYHRPNLERAPKGRLPLVCNMYCLFIICNKDTICRIFYVFSLWSICNNCILCNLRNMHSVYSIYYKCILHSMFTMRSPFGICSIDSAHNIS